MADVSTNDKMNKNAIDHRESPQKPEHALSKDRSKGGVRDTGQGLAPTPTKSQKNLEKLIKRC